MSAASGSSVALLRSTMHVPADLKLTPAVLGKLGCVVGGAHGGAVVCRWLPVWRVEEIMGVASTARRRHTLAGALSICRKHLFLLQLE